MSLKLIPGYHMAAVSLPYWPHCPLTPLIDDSLIGVNYDDPTSAEHLLTGAIAQNVIANLNTQSFTLNIARGTTDPWADTITGGTL